MKKIKLVLIGYGNMGRDWRKIIEKNKNIQLVGVVDILKKNRIAARRDFSLKNFQVSDNLEKILSLSNPDAVIDASPPFAHFRNAKIALNYSCHVLGEKPMSLYFDQAKELIALSKTTDKIYMINQNYRRNPIIKIIKDKMKKLGAIYSVNIDYYQSLEFKETFRYTMSHPLLLDMAIHHFDLVRMIINQDAKSVYASEYNPVTSNFKNGSSAFAHFTMNNGIFFSYRGSWSSIVFNTSFNGKWRIVGEYGTLLWDGDSIFSIEKRTDSRCVHKEDVGIPDEFELKPYELFLHELEQNLELFLSSISTGSLPDCWCGDNINSLEMVLSAIKSAESGKIVDIRGKTKYS